MSILENAPCALEKDVLSAALGWVILYMSVSSSSFIVLSLLLHYWLTVYLFYSLLKVEITVSNYWRMIHFPQKMFSTYAHTFWGSVTFGYVYYFYAFIGGLTLYQYTIPFFISCNINFKSILTYICITIPAQFWLPFAWNIFYCPFTFKLFVSWL